MRFSQTVPHTMDLWLWGINYLTPKGFPRSINKDRDNCPQSERYGVNVTSYAEKYFTSRLFISQCQRRILGPPEREARRNKPRLVQSELFDVSVSREPRLWPPRIARGEPLVIRMDWIGGFDFFLISEIGAVLHRYVCVWSTCDFKLNIVYLFCTISIKKCFKEKSCRLK